MPALSICAGMAMTMEEDKSIPWLAKLAGTKAFLYNIVHQIVTAGVFLIGKLGIPPNVAAENPVIGYFFTGLDYWVAVNLIVMAFVIIKRPFTTPHVLHAKCFRCGSQMEASKLLCPGCGATFDASK